MSFNWKQYLSQAETLKNGNNEADYRSAISRAYYAVYHTLKPRFGAQDISPSAHFNLIKTLKSSHPKEGLLLETLFNWRKKSDYKAHIEVKKFNADFHVEQANRILKNLGY